MKTLTLFRTLTLVMLVSTTACTTVPNTKGYNGAGTIIGAAGGSYIGGRFGPGSAIAGGLFGAYTGYNIIRLFGEKRDYAMEAFQKAAEYNSAGVTANWRDPHRFENGSYTPIRTVKSPTGVYCREILETVKISGRLYSNEVNACRDEKGVWVVEK